MSDQQEIKNRRKARIFTVVFHVILFALFAFVGLTYQDPPPEEGIAINFGYDEQGSGDTESSPREEDPTPVQTPVETSNTVDETATQEMVDAPVVKADPKKKDPEKVVEEPKKVEEPKPTASQALQDRLKAAREAQGSGQGVTQGGGDQGDPNGDKNVNNYTGSGGTGTSGNYRLGNRAALSRPKPVYDCSDEGRVVVKVYVDRNGKVLRAEPGAAIKDGPSTNTTSSCLLDKAKDAALRTTWQGDQTAQEQQVGYIIYNFSKT